MKTWLKRIAIGLGSVVAVLVVVGLLLPNEYTVRRSVVIDADAWEIHHFVGDLSKWDAWAPWKEDDPNLVVTLGENTSGMGASQSWVGKDGDGSLRVTASSEGRGIEYDLFFNGGAYKCRSAMRYQPREENTTVIWIMKGEMSTPVIGGYVAATMDSSVGPMFERGLAKLKEVAEHYAEENF